MAKIWIVQWREKGKREAGWRREPFIHDSRKEAELKAKEGNSNWDHIIHRVICYESKQRGA